METLFQPRRESQTHFSSNESSAHHEPRDHFFYHERLCQYVPYFDQSSTPSSLTDECRRIIGLLIFPRLVVIRVKHVLVALMPILNLTDDGTFGVVLHDVSSVLSPLGWVLHGLRLLINALQLLQTSVAMTWLNDAENKRSWCDPVNITVQRNGVAMGNDFIWVLSSLAPNTIQFTGAFFVVDIVWLSARAWIEIVRLNGLLHSENAAMDKRLLLEITKDLSVEKQKFLLNLANLVSISAISIMKNFVLPTILPVLALNPLLLLTLSLLSLVITIASHLLGQSLEKQKSMHANKESERPSISNDNTSPLSFFRITRPANDEDIRQSINTTCAF